MTAKEKGDRPINGCSDRPEANAKLSLSHCTSDQVRSLNKAHLKDLRNSGLADESIAEIRHFSADVETASSLVGCKLPGLIFSYFEPDGKPYLCSNGIPFYRIKPDWGDRKTEDSPKYLSPKDQGCRPYFSCLYSDWPKAIKSTKIDLWETEGEKKGDCGCANGLAAIAFAGVDAWVDSHDRSTGEELAESRVLPELGVIEWKHRKVYQCFDSDIIEKFPVQTALAKRAFCLHQLGAYPHLVLLPNESDGSKNGLDDFVVRHGINALRVLGREAELTPFKTQDKANGKETTVTLDLKEPESHCKAVMAWAVLKESWAYRPGIGWYEWQENCWRGTTDEEFEASLTCFMDAQKWKKRSSGLISSVIREVRSRLLVREDLWNPFGKLAFKNGTLNIMTGRFFPTHSPQDRMTQIRPFNYDLSAECPAWLGFLHQAMEGDQERIDLIQAIFRYAVLPRCKDQKAEIEKSFDLFGQKGTGKGTTLDVLTNLVGPENVGSASVDTFKTAVGLGQLVDKVLAVDYDASGFLSNVGAYNRVVSNEPVEVKKLYEDSYTTRLGIVVIRAYNAFVNVPDGSEGLDRRLTVVPFRHQPREVDTSLSSKFQEELPGIFAWCYSISREEMKGRLLSAGRIKAVAEASIERFEANNPEFRFIVDTFPEGMDSVKAGNLYQSYLNWCGMNKHHAKSNVKFFNIVRTLGCQRSPGKINGCYYYTVPKMSDFDIAQHLGIVKRQFGESYKDSSKLDTEGDRDSWGEFESKSHQNFEQPDLEDLGSIDQSINQKLVEEVSTTLPNPSLVNHSSTLQPSSTVTTISTSFQPGDRVKVLIQDSWESATLIQNPINHPYPSKRTSFWIVKLEAGKEDYIWDSDNIRPLDNPHPLVP